MSEQDNTPEQVAYRLLRDIAMAEGKYHGTVGFKQERGGNRKYILDTYAECVKAVRGGRLFLSEDTEDS